MAILFVKFILTLFLLYLKHNNNFYNITTFYILYSKKKSNYELQTLENIGYEYLSARCNIILGTEIIQLNYYITENIINYKPI